MGTEPRAEKPRVWYKLPNDSTVYFLEHSPSTIDQKNPEKQILKAMVGFSIAPFAVGKEPTGHRSFIEGTASIFDAKNHPTIDDCIHPTEKAKPFCVDQEGYLSNCRNYLEQIKAGELEKAVLSRVETTSGAGISRHKLFDELCTSYPSAFVYYLQSQTHGNWMGATPETLLTVDQTSFTTMALAGTQVDAGLPLPHVSWGAKEKHEQALVTKEIVERIKMVHTAKGPETVRAGNVLHLQTTIRGKIVTQGFARAAQIGNLITALHPTPAVCGLPREKAFALIQKEEHHKRELYTGFLGLFDPKNETQLFVNLRCMQDFGDEFALYLGGGITSDSDPTKEWEETELKAQTLLSVIEKMRKLTP
jgi:isochorismate synthase